MPVRITPLLFCPAPFYLGYFIAPNNFIQIFQKPDFNGFFRIIPCPGCPTFGDSVLVHMLIGRKIRTKRSQLFHFKFSTSGIYFGKSIKQGTMNLSWQNAEIIKEWIPIEKCRDGHLYLIAARNSTLGIYRVDKQYFEIRRQKGNEIYRFCGEYHWDWQGGEILFGKKLLGTCKPIKEIEQVPVFKSEKEFIVYMEKMFKILQKT